MNDRDIALIGFAVDEGVRRNNGRVGAADGPKAFREALHNCHPSEGWGPGIADIVCHDGDLESAQAELGTRVLKSLRDGHTSFVIGGGHETAWGHFQGISQFLADRNCGIINFDAHFDLRPLIDDKLGSSGTPFTQIALERQTKGLEFDYLVIGIQPLSNSQTLFERASKFGARYVLAENIDHDASAQIDAMLQRHEHIYLSICLDVFAASVAPGVSAPAALGVLPEQILPLLQRIKQSGKMIAFDIVELAPPYDRNGMTAMLAAHLTLETPFVVSDP